MNVKASFPKATSLLMLAGALVAVLLILDQTGCGSSRETTSARPSESTPQATASTPEIATFPFTWIEDNVEITVVGVKDLWECKQTPSARLIRLSKFALHVY